MKTDDVDFNTDVFADDDRPFAAHIEMEGLSRLAHLKVWNRASHWDNLPITCAIADAMFDSLTQTDRWGRQIHKGPNRTPTWTQESRGGWYMARGGKHRPGQPLTPKHICRFLARGDVYAHGRTDAHGDDMEHYPYGTGQFRTTLVDCLCLDVDMDLAWEQHDIEAVKRELSRERIVAEAFGLPYRVFRTGGRGHQCVMPFPAPVDRSAAAWILFAYRLVLASLHSPEDNVEIDKSNLQGIVRLAGGKHIKTGRLALWIDLETGRLYDLPAQIEMMKNGYRHPACDPCTRDIFVVAAQEIADQMESLGCDRYFCPKQRTICNDLVLRVALALPDNPLVRLFGSACAWTGLESNNCKPAVVKKMRQPIATQRPELVGEGLTTWAQSIWNMSIQPGESWDYFSESGHRAITASRILFGNDALTQIEAKIDRESDSRSRAEERKTTVATLFDSHKMYWFDSRPGNLIVNDLDLEAYDLIHGIIDALHRTKKIQKRTKADIAKLAFVLLAALTQSETGYFEASLDMLTASILAIWPEDDPKKRIDRSTVGRHLRRLKAGDPDCGYSLVAEIRQDQSGQVMASRYRPGPDLRNTAWGKRLPMDSIVDAPAPQIGPLPMLVRRAGAICIVDVAPCRRGRKRAKKE